MTEIESMLACIRKLGRLFTADLREGPRPETERALGAAFKRAIFTCGYCGGHCRVECDPDCRVKDCEQQSSSRRGSR